MKQSYFLRVTLSAILLLGIFSFTTVTKSYAQEMVQYTWSDYKTKFSVPSTFNVTKSSGTEWQGSDNDIALSIFPEKGKNLNQREIERLLRSWASEQGVGSLTDATNVDSKKLNGYWGVFIEGTKDAFPVCLMIIVDPDYPDTYIQIWVSYRDGLVDTVLKILFSFTPS